MTEINLPYNFKPCKKCGGIKPATTEYFAKAKRNRDGLFSYCRECEKLRTKSRVIQYREEYIEKAKLAEKNWRVKNKEYLQQYNTIWKKANPEKIKQFNHIWYLKNKEKITRKSAIRNKRIRLLVPNDIEIIKQIKEIYFNCPTGYEVDHIVPLKHDLVCGLHVPWNLQYLLQKDNRAKGNKFMPYKGSI
jgi:5-methylcytosine-specific restriction endonuclease McrA